MVHRRDERHADVASDKGRKARSLEDLTQERRGGGLAVRSRYADQWLFEKPTRDLDFRDDRDSAPSRGLKLWQTPGYSGADHNQVLPEESLLAMSAEFQSHLLGKQLREVGPEFRRGARIRQGHECPAQPQEARYSAPAAREAHDQHVLSTKVKHLRPGIQDLKNQNSRPTVHSISNFTSI